MENTKETVLINCEKYGIFPDELKKCNELIVSIAKKFNLTEDMLNLADERAIDIANMMLHTEQRPLDRLTQIINLARLKEIIQTACDINNLSIQDFDFDADGSDIWTTYRNKEIQIQ